MFEFLPGADIIYDGTRNKKTGAGEIEKRSRCENTLLVLVRHSILLSADSPDAALLGKEKEAP